MSVNINTAGAVQAPQSTFLTGTTATVVYTAREQVQSKVIGISIVNEDSSACLVTLEWNDGTTDRKFWRKSVAANDTEIIDQIVIALYGKAATQTIKATAATADKITITVVVVEDYTRTAGAK